MDWITNSKLFKGSKRQSKILAAVNDPINQPLIKQLESYVDPEYAEHQKDLIDKSVEKVDEILEKEDEVIEDVKNDPKSHHESRPHVSHTSPSPKVDIKSPEVELDSNESSEETSTEPKVDEEPVVEESTKLESKPIQASSFITIENVSQAVNEIPGMLNLREDTAGVDYCTLKSNNSEFWIYYNKDVDINKVLVNLSLAVAESGYSFLVFDRVSRDDNAVIMTVNWISSYQPLNYTSLEVDNEK